MNTPSHQFDTHLFTTLQLHGHHFPVNWWTSFTRFRFPRDKTINLLTSGISTFQKTTKMSYLINSLSKLLTLCVNKHNLFFSLKGFFFPILVPIYVNEPVKMSFGSWRFRLYSGQNMKEKKKKQRKNNRICIFDEHSKRTHHICVMSLWKNE